MVARIYLRLKAPHMSKRQSLFLSKTPIQGVERWGYLQERGDGKKSIIKTMEKAFTEHETSATKLIKIQFLNFRFYLENNWSLVVSFLKAKKIKN